MNTIKSIFLALCWAMIAFGCSVDKTIDDSINGAETLQSGEYVRLNLSTNSDDVTSDATRNVWEDAKGSGNLAFKWESVDINSDKTSQLTFVLSNGKSAIVSKTPSQADASYSGLSVTPNEKNSRRAKFQTVNYYATNDLKSAVYCYSVAGNAVISEDATKGEHLCHLEMPSTFTQSV